MSITGYAAVSLATVVATLAGGWLVTTRVTDYWDRVKKDREMSLAAAQEFERLYGEVVAIWKTWNALVGSYTAAFAAPEHAQWDCLKRATAAEGAIEALMAKLAAERFMEEPVVDVLGGVRQAFKVVRRTIRAGEPLNWRSSEVEPYVAFKTLSAATSVFLATPPSSKERPNTAAAAKAFRAITHNRHETLWITTASSAGITQKDHKAR
ncbi:hypothetical protein AB0D86_15890 [Streptomyces sp. NPDC048324]|uniref:hypothetical protein n=1 Tax=Streptomyces sp. NPDC048324 TaxID=3157205 RepID=UPI00343B9961